MFDHTPQRQPYRSRPHTCNAAVSLLLAAGVPAVVWAISYPLSAVLVAVVVAAVVRGVRALRMRVADQSSASSSAVAARQTDGP